MRKSSSDEDYEEDFEVDPEPMPSIDMKIDKEDALFVLAEIPLVGNINLQP